jgi:2-oxoglutarate dehydrogenase E2 component (dihydrolipoamide succinyltransferase)
MTTEFTLPALGASVTEATVTRWFKKVGDPVAFDEALLEVSTDKVDTEVPSPITGTLAAIVAEEGATVEIGAVLATIVDAQNDEPGESLQLEPSEPAVASLSSPPSQTAAGERGGAEQGLLPARPATPEPTGSALAPSTTSPSPLRGQTIKLGRVRKLIAERMTDSLRRSAQLTQVVEVDVTDLARIREATKAEFGSREGTKLTYLPFFARATLDALQQHPSLNARIDTEAGMVTYHDREHLAIAVDTDRGLYTPVIQDAGAMSVAELAKSIADVAERVRTNKIRPDELSGGTFTITNLGSFGALFDTPIINQPQVAILGPGAVTKRPVVVDEPNLGETIALRYMVYLSLSYDHRLIDGADAGRFLQEVKRRLEAAQFAV